MDRPDKERHGDNETEQLVNQYLGPLPAPNAGQSLEATLLGVSRKSFVKDFGVLGAAVVFETRAWAGAVFKRFIDQVRRKKWIAQAAMSFFMSDETPLVSGKHFWRGEGNRPELGTSKMIQNELVLGLVFKDKESGTSHFWTVPILLPLQCADRTTGENMYTLWKEAADIPLWDEASRLCEKRYELRTMDRAGPNLRADRELESKVDSLHIALACDAHIVSTVTGHSYVPVNGMLTGLIVLSLATRLGGHYTSFIAVLTRIIEGSVRITDCAPHRMDHPWAGRCSDGFVLHGWPHIAIVRGTNTDILTCKS
jgi:hypothetical protein